MPRRTRVLALAVAALLLAGTGTAIANRTIPEPAPELPVLHGETARGSLVYTGTTRAARTDKVVDGSIADWTGVGSRLGGTTVRSAGELIYSDYLFDAYGADDGGDAERLATLDPLNEGVPETYRLDPIFQLDLAGELGVDNPTGPSAEEQYGDAGDRSIDAADLLELRLSADGGNLYVLGRTTTMLDAASTALLLLVDSVPGSPAYDVPFGSGLRTTTGDAAVYLAASGSRVVDLATGASTPLTDVAIAPDGYTNAIEAALPLKALGVKKGKGRVAAVTGLSDGVGGFANLANVAFRGGEPVRTWMEKQQALELQKRSIDPFFADLDVSSLRRGVTDRWYPGAGYYERIFTSSEAVSKESGQDGIHQPYGVYLSPGYKRAVPAPATFWLHWRGGKTHSAATVSPRIMRDFGDGMRGIVIAPRGRGTSTWYLGRGQVDVEEVRADALRSFPIDENRVYVSGHSMGGFGSYLMSTLRPDWFAAALPVAGPVTQGMWTGADFEGCDDMQYEDEYSPCYTQTNNGDARVQHTRRLLKNLRNTPIGIYQGGADELVWTSGVTRQVEELVNLGYRHRYYLFPTYEHYTHPVVDEWAEGARYLSQFTRDPNPARVTYVRDMPFERTVESGPNQGDGVTEASFAFDSAYWMSGLTPADAENGVASFDGRSLALPSAPTLTVPEAGGPSSVGQVGPYTMTGLAWLADPLAAAASPVNGFELTLTGVSSVTLDAERMGLDMSKPLVTKVTTDRPVEVRVGGQTLRFTP